MHKKQIIDEAISRQSNFEIGDERVYLSGTRPLELRPWRPSRNMARYTTMLQIISNQSRLGRAALSRASM